MDSFDWGYLAMGVYALVLLVPALWYGRRR